MDDLLVLQQGHDLASSGDCGDGNAAAGDGLPEGGQIRYHAIACLCSAHAEAHARDHLVEDQYDAVFGTQFS